MKFFLFGTFRFINSVIMFMPFHCIRAFWTKIFLGKKGKNVYFSRNIDIRNPRNIYIGSNCVFNKKIVFDGRTASIHIGNNVDIAQEVNIWTLEHDILGDKHESVAKNVVIGDNVWIASRVSILPGVTIGTGAVIACGAIVTKDIPPLAIAGGIPAKIIKCRRSMPEFNLSAKRYFE
ncbi:hypothetical protein FACS189479_10090 [Spirochaetia bacterium]|nr:hypothetical protein FACS189479_10090 [Spirochaetia bacterium]